MPPPTSSTSLSSQEDVVNKSQQQQCFVWRRDSVLSKDAVPHDETYESLLQQFSAPLPPPKSLLELIMKSVLVGQEFVLTCLFLARHRVVLWEEELLLLVKGTDATERHLRHEWLQPRVQSSHGLALAALMLIALFANSRAAPRPQQTRKAKVLQRVSDALLLALFLRIEASVLQTLTASFSTDTVERLTLAGMILHVFTCDYSYAHGGGTTSGSGHDPPLSNNNNHNKRPTFQGGTVSLNAAFFSTMLLASRLETEATLQVYIFVASSIILFAFFPASRHAISQHPQGRWVHVWTTWILTLATVCLLKDRSEILAFGSVLLVICGMAPLWKHHLQQYKRKISGPWEVVSVQDMMLKQQE